MALSRNRPKPRETTPRVLFAVVAPLRAFFRTQAASGIVLFAATAQALVLANSPLADWYHKVLEQIVEFRFGPLDVRFPVHHWINDALMALFFLVAGLEVKQAIAVGELRTFRKAIMPLIAAAGGMLVPALFFLAINPHTPTRAGWGIPMATDIAFALGCLSLVRSRVPASLFIFLTALAIFDDLGAIVVIALFYGSELKLEPLLLACGLTVILFVMSKARIHKPWPYLLVGLALWGATLASGIHATLAGVILGLAMPAKPRTEPKRVLEDLGWAMHSVRQASMRDEMDQAALLAMERHLENMQSPLVRLLHALEKPVSFIVVPLFALANAGITFGPNTASELISPVTLGVAAGLAVGKPIGVFGATFAAVKAGLGTLPKGTSKKQLLGVSHLAGIGFTMSLFIAMLGYANTPHLIDGAKLGVLGGSLISIAIGLGLLLATRAPEAATAEPDEVPVLTALPPIAAGFSMRPWVPAGPLVGRTLAEADIRRRFDVLVVGVFRTARLEDIRKRELEPASPDYRFRPEDVVVVVGDDAAVERFASGAETEPA